MLLIPCPHCGPCAQTEFSYGGDATVKRPADANAVSLDAWLDYVYLRENPCGSHQEWWYHSAGCHQWIEVTRDTRTHKFEQAKPAPARAGNNGDQS